MALTERTRSPSSRLLDVVRSPRPGSPDAVALIVRAGGAGVLAAGCGLIVATLLVLGGWAAGPHAESHLLNVAQVGVGVFLLAHHITLEVASGPFGLTPMVATLLPLAATYLAGRHCAGTLGVRSLADAARIVVTITVGYGLTCAVVSGAVGGSLVRPHAWEAFVMGVWWAALGAGAGVVRRASLTHDLWLAVPSAFRQVLVGAGTSLLVIVGCSALLVAVSLAFRFGDALEYAHVLEAGGFGGLFLAMLSLGYLPNVVTWAAAFVAGPGFSVGVGTHVSPQSVDYGTLPVFPPLSAIPTSGTGGGAWLMVLLIPVAAGVVAAWVVHRRLPPELTPGRVAGWGLGCGALSGVGFAFLAWWASGPVSAGHLRSVGVSPATGLVVALQVGLVAAMVCWELRRRSR